MNPAREKLPSITPYAPPLPLTPPPLPLHVYPMPRIWSLRPRLSTKPAAPMQVAATPAVHPLRVSSPSPRKTPGRAPRWIPLTSRQSTKAEDMKATRGLGASGSRALRDPAVGWTLGRPSDWPVPRRAPSGGLEASPRPSQPLEPAWRAGHAAWAVAIRMSGCSETPRRADSGRGDSEIPRLSVYPAGTWQGWGVGGSGEASRRVRSQLTSS